MQFTFTDTSVHIFDWKKTKINSPAVGSMVQFYIPGEGVRTFTITDNTGFWEFMFDRNSIESGIQYEIRFFGNGLVPGLSPNGDWETFAFPGNSSSSSSSDKKLGLPSDGVWSDGLIKSFDEHTTIADSIDDLNELLLKIAPADAFPLSGDLDIVFSNGSYETVKYPGILSNNSACTYEDDRGPGANNTQYIITDANFRLNSPSNGNSSPKFNKGKEGTLQLVINGIVKDSITLSQNGDTLTGSNSKLSATKSTYNTIWDRAIAQLTIISDMLRKGYNLIQLKHIISDSDIRIASWKCFYDSVSTAPTFSNMVYTLSIPIIKCISGIKYYTTGTTFNVTGTANNCQNDTLIDSPVSVYSNFTNISTTSHNGLQHDATININSQVSISQGKRCETEKILVSGTKPGARVGAANEVYSGFAYRLVDSVADDSTDLLENFNGEARRITLTSDFNATGLTPDWNPESALQNGNAQILAGNLVYPTKNYDSAYIPEQAVNYSIFSGSQKYYRAFIKNNSPHTSGKLYISPKTTISAYNENNTNGVSVRIKLPGLTQWMDLGTAYNSQNDFTTDNQGCYVENQSAPNSSQFAWSSGNFSTANSNYRIYVEVTLWGVTDAINTLQEMGW